MSEEYQQGYEQGARDFAERIKRYYDNPKSRTPCSLVSFHVDQILNEMLKEGTDSG